jgi:peptidoglycan/xylan/chitin deacetylase (PgdA/CDA1 family)
MARSVGVHTSYLRLNAGGGNDLCVSKAVSPRIAAKGASQPRINSLSSDTSITPKSKRDSAISATAQRLKSALIGTAGLSGLPRLLAPAVGGVGAIIAMHRVREPRNDVFQPNRTLEVTPDFLDSALSRIRDLGLEIISLDEAAARLRAGGGKRRFVCLTLDDGYADNYENAAPIFDAHGAPFSIYATTGFIDGTAYFWWMLLEDVIRERDEVALRLSGQTERRGTRTLQEKDAAFFAFHDHFRRLSPDEVEAASRDLCEDYGIDIRAFNGREAMTWEMAKEITERGLGRIEAHTERHIALSLQSPEDIRSEMTRASARIAEMTGRAPGHFAYPFGDDKAVSRSAIDVVAHLGLTTAVTTKSGNLKPDHGKRMTALPRVTLNGLYQSRAFVDLALSGLPYVFSKG